MIASALAGNGPRRARWAISFADLCLLLLGFFVLMHASDRSRDAIVKGVGDYFGARPGVQPTELLADSLFEPGEALLTLRGNVQLKGLAVRAATEGRGFELISVGQVSSGNRFDGWDLAAARLGAVARALQQSGIPRDRLTIRGLDERDKAGRGQTIILSPTKPSR